MLDTIISACLNSSQASSNNSRPAAKAAPLFSDTSCRITTGPASKAAMNRPKRFRGLATDPGVQRKTSKAVIQRENKPKGPRLEKHLIKAGDGRQ
ncbi:hypothetical protein [Pseudomonas sp. KBW05]|uniref:hypothetical protein n=1 Tax=Pseudomonas sp. KBW05 TaxID=2153360 RepID=UPI000F594489|nr:hypothetical protein [Pseudomonas sp. KBW05]